jgi:hypothetical protein
MTRPNAAAVLRTSAVQRCVTGALLTCVPDAVTGLIAGDMPRPPHWLVRVLGGRLLIQGLVEYTRPRQVVVLVGIAVDAAHAASMVAAAVLLPAYRRTAAASAAEATVAAALAVSVVRRLP